MKTNETMHPVGDDPAWSESYYFNFADPKTGLGMFTRMGFRPRNGWADALHVVYLGKERVAFTYGRRDIGTDLSVYDGDLKVGGLTLTCKDPHRLWGLNYEGPAQDIADSAILLTRAKTRPEGWFSPANLSMSLDFECLTKPHFAAEGAHGHFEQSGRVTGQLTLGGETRTFEGYGVRDKSWGPRNWGGGSGSGGQPALSSATAPNPFVFWFSMNFGAEASLGGSLFRGKDGELRGEGWIQEGDVHEPLKDVVGHAVFRDGSILHDRVRLEGVSASGKRVSIEGEMVGMCPTKIPFPGGATFVNEGLARFTMDGRTGFGIAELWHNVKE